MSEAQAELDRLKALKAQWYQEARASGQIAICWKVAVELGRALNARYGPKYEWTADGVKIEVDAYGNYMTIIANGRLVCSTHLTRQLFLPGEWLDVVLRHLPECEAKRTDAQDNAAWDAVRALRQELGIAEALL